MSKFLKEALLYKKNDDYIQCLTCNRLCKIKNNEVGFCGTRKNIKNKLYTTVYGNISFLSLNPIEKKPFFHFYPSTYALTCGTFSCNFPCCWCQNYDISKVKDVSSMNGEFISPEQFIKLNKRYNSAGTSISFNGPTLLLEWSVEVFKLAKKENLYNTFVTNGYITKEALDILIDSGLDAINVDIKGDKEFVEKYCDADIDLIFKNCRIAKERNIHIELTTLLIEGLNDKEESIEYIAKRIVNELGRDTPYHITCYYPAYKLRLPQTSISRLEAAYNIAKNNDLEFVYIGNVPGHKYENTYCPKCNELLIKRYIFDIIENKISNKKCYNCGYKISEWI